MRPLLLFFATAGLSCGGSGVTQYGTEQDNGACANPPVTLTGTQPPGASCTSDSDCATACCTCETGITSSSFTLAACQDGVCAQDEVVCEDAEDSNASLCP